MKLKKKLIEVALPLETINIQSAREKSIRHGHPSTLHLWWARRPLAAARAVIWASLVDDPSSLPERFPTEEEQTAERERLFKILSELVKWENSNNQDILAAAKDEIMKSTGGNPPALLDPFAGGGAIPLEAQRLGLEAYASDLNPIAVIINKAMIEIPPKFSGQPPINPESLRKLNQTWVRAQGLADDVRYYGEWMKQKAFEHIGYLYPKVKDNHGKERMVIAWIWARTIKCPNPACGCEMPLASSFILSKKKGKEAYIQPVIEGNKIRYEVHQGKDAPEPPKTGRGQFKCICCGEVAKSVYIRNEFTAKRSSSQLMAIVAEGDRGRLFLAPNKEHMVIANCNEPAWKPEAEMNQECTDLVSGRGYGFSYWYEIFTNRQLSALTALSSMISETRCFVMRDGGSEVYADAIIVYLALVVSKLSDCHSSICSWNISEVSIRNVFSRQAMAMSWDFAEANPFSSSSGSYSNVLERVTRCLDYLPSTSVQGISLQRNAQTDSKQRDIMVSTDPPYYDNIGYADISDFFYIWLRQSLRDIYPRLFSTMLVPKDEELVAAAHRFKGSKIKANSFFEAGMLDTFKQIRIYCHVDIPVTVYYAYKQSEYESGKTSSTGWETMLSAIIQAGFSINGTWPIRTEFATRSIGQKTNALSSSIVLVCRKRPSDAQICTRRDFINTLKREINPAMSKLQASNIAPVDLAQSAIGPGMGVYSRFSKLLEADGTPMSVRSALQIVNQELDIYFSEQDSELDRDSRFCVDLYTQYAFNDMQFGEADVLARAKNTSVDRLVGRGVLYAQKGVVRLLTREEVSTNIVKTTEITWLLTQQLTRTMETGGGVQEAAKIVIELLGSGGESAKALAYRLFTLAERKGWTQEAFAYNSLVTAWPEIQAAVNDIQSQEDSKQMSMFSAGGDN